MKYFVSRHPGAVEWAAQNGHADVEVVKHLDMSIVKRADIVLGTLPCHMAAQVWERGADYYHLTMTIPEHFRGKELTADDMEVCGAKLEYFAVLSGHEICELRRESREGM